MENKKIKKIVREEINDWILEKIVYTLLIIIYLGSWAGLCYVMKEYWSYTIDNVLLNLFIGICLFLWLFINLLPIFRWLADV